MHAEGGTPKREECVQKGHCSPILVNGEELSDLSVEGRSSSHRNEGKPTERVAPYLLQLMEGEQNTKDTRQHGFCLLPDCVIEDPTSTVRNRKAEKPGGGHYNVRIPNTSNALFIKKKLKRRFPAQTHVSPYELHVELLT